MGGDSTRDIGGDDSQKDVEAYIMSSKYRTNVLEHLAREDSATPKEIADVTGDPRPHVSRALSELRETDIVELQVPENRTVGRYYGLTESGENAWKSVKSEVRTVRWSIEEPTDPTIQSIVKLARDEFGTALRGVGTYDSETFTVWYARPDVRSSYSTERFEETLQTLLLDHSLEDINISERDCLSETIHFGGCLVCRIRIERALRVLISFDESRNVSIPEFSKRVRSLAESDEGDGS